MKRFYGLNIIFNFLIAILCACFFSCDYLCDEDLKMRLDEETFTKIHFYSNKEDSLVSGEQLFLTVRSYRIGDTISEKDLPTYNDSEISQWKTGYRLGGWKYYRWTLSQQQIPDSSLITSITITPDELDLYAVWFVPYTVTYKYQNNDKTGYDVKKEIRYGEPGTFTDVNPPEISAFSTPVYLDTTILEDGSTEVVVTYNREYFTNEIDYSNPDIKVYELGKVENFTGTINLSGSTKVDFAVNNDIYEYITDADVSGQKVIYVSIMNDNGDVMFTNKVNIDSTTKKATVDLITDSSGSNSITSSGIYHAVIYTKASSLYANIYFERVYFNILVLP